METVESRAAAGRYCEICGGARTIRLLRRKRLAAKAVDDSLPDGDVRVESSVFPCPECAVSAPLDRVHLVECTVLVEDMDRYPAAMREDFLPRMKIDACQQLGVDLMRRGFVVFEEGPDNRFGAKPLHATVAVAKRADALSFSTRIKQSIEVAIGKVTEAMIRGYEEKPLLPFVDLVKAASAAVSREYWRKEIR